jgi:hypothetical protein|tara:strand:- start:240 stop:560 length:321 start_codon:yes stop_codon:yes gene_type:complete
MRIEITGRGIYGRDGEIPIGTQVDLKSEPLGWRGRYKIVTDDPKSDAQPITNPARETDEDRSAVDEDLDEITALRDRYEALTGGSADKRWKENTLRDKIAEAEASE